MEANVQKSSARVTPAITDDIADTLFINLLMKCREHRRADGFYKDPEACRIVESVDYDFTRFEKAQKTSASIAMRAKHFDDVTAEFIRSRPKPVVVFIGCGLDARYHRLENMGEELTDKAVFYELDLPEVTELRGRLLPPGDNDSLLPGSVLETDWMDELKNAHPDADFLFTLEGVFIYFDKEQVKQVMGNLASRFSGGRVLFDATSGWLCRNQHRIAGTRITKAPMKLALDDEKEVEDWAENLRLESSLFYPDLKDFGYAGLFQKIVCKVAPVVKKSSRIICCALD
jgi:O-methyltransferase involved in polyketide biosynthesis